MLRALLLSALVVVMALSGCLGGNDEPDDTEPTNVPDDGDGGNGGNGNQTGDDFGANVTVSTFVVTIDDAPTSVSKGAPINVSWRVESGAEAGAGGNSSGNGTSANATVENETRPLAETGVAWGYTSQPEPTTTDDYENTEVAEENTEAPGEWNISFTPGDANGTGNGTSGGNGTGNGTANGTTVYLRAYAIDENGTVAWSQEVEVEVTEEEPFVIEIGAGPVDGPFATYSPATATVKIGQPIIWDNVDSTGAAHTATSSAGPESFDTGQIPAGEESEPIILTQPGTYTYSCTVHPNTMPEGTITVEP